MSSKLLMMSSAVMMGIIGIILNFLPEETIRALDQPPSETSILILQLMGALYFGFAILNWMAKNVLIGGIYAKPLSLGNLVHFFVGGLTLLKIILSHSTASMYVWILTILYLTFALAFGFVSFTSPNLKSKE